MAPPQALALLLVVSLIAASAAALAPAPWPVIGHDSANTNSNLAILRAKYCSYKIVTSPYPYLSLSVPAPDAALLLMVDESVQFWAFANISQSRKPLTNTVNITVANRWLGSAIDGSEINFVNGGSENGEIITAVSPWGPKPLWNAQISGSSGMRTAYHTYANAIDSISQQAVRVDAETGAVMWRSALPPLPQQQYNHLLGVQSGDILLQAGSGNTVTLLMLNGQTGAVRWATNLTFPNLTYGSLTATSSADIVVLSLNTPPLTTVTALLLSSGKTLWQTTVPCNNIFYTTWTMLNGSSAIAYACKGSTTIGAIDPGSGKSYPARSLPVSVFNTLCGTGDSRVVLVATLPNSPSSYVLAIADLATGVSSTVATLTSGFPQIAIDNKGRIYYASPWEAYVLDAC